MPSIRVGLTPLVLLLCCCSSDESASSVVDAAADMTADTRSAEDTDRDLPSQPDGAPPADVIHQPDVEPDADADPGTDAANSCQQFKTPIGRSLTVTYGSMSIDFSTGTFDCDYNEDLANAEYYWYYIFRSANGKYGLELRLPTKGVTCPSSFTLPVSDKAVLIFFDAATFTGLATSGHPGSSGTLTVEGNITTSTHKEVEISCTNCVLGAVPGSFDTVQVSGGAHQKK